MRAFRFGLQRVLNYRETVEDKLLGELASINHEHEREVGRLQQKRKMVADFRARMREKLAQADAETLRRSQSYLQVLLEEVIHQEQVVEEVTRRKEAKTAEVVEASKDRQVLERLKEIKAAEHRAEVLADEQKFLDDLAGMRHRSTTGAGTHRIRP